MWIEAGSGLVLVAFFPAGRPFHAALPLQPMYKQRSAPDGQGTAATTDHASPQNPASEPYAHVAQIEFIPIRSNQNLGI